jgi:hypothetical protein
MWPRESGPAFCLKN